MDKTVTPLPEWFSGYRRGFPWPAGPVWEQHSCENFCSRYGTHQESWPELWVSGNIKDWRWDNWFITYWNCLVMSSTVMALTVAWEGMYLNTLRLTQKGCHFPDHIFNFIFINEKFCILINISLKLIPKGLIDNIPALVQIMAWCRPGNKPLSEVMIVNLLMHIYVTRPQWVKRWTTSTFTCIKHLNLGRFFNIMS